MKKISKIKSIKINEDANSHLFTILTSCISINILAKAYVNTNISKYLFLIYVGSPALTVYFHIGAKAHPNSQLGSLSVTRI